MLAFVINISIYKAQSNVNHPTIQNVTVGYRSAQQSNPSLGVQAVPNMTVSVISGTNVSKIYFKISDNITNAQIYQASYAMNASPVISNGNVIFKNINGLLMLSSGQPLAVKPYRYELWTEDDEHNPSTIYAIAR